MSKYIKIKGWRDIPENYTGIVEYHNGRKDWFLNGKRHRTNGPAIEYADGSKVWYIDDELYRTDGPAIEYADGRKYWYLNDKQYTREEHFQYVAEHSPESIRKLIWNL